MRGRDGPLEGARPAPDASACPGLFATAYGNVGSSIYYALGLVAAHALGLTPLVFIFAGGLFALTAKTYAEGASMFPEAGGSSSFARHAFNEVVSFFAGWALIARLHHHDRDQRLLRPALPGRVLPGAAATARATSSAASVVIALLAAAQHPRARRVGQAQHRPRGRSTSSPRSRWSSLGAVLVLNPSLLVNQVHLGVAPSYTQLIFALSISMVAYTGIETVSNMAEEARDPGERRAAHGQPTC